MIDVDLSVREKVRLVGWASLAASSAIAWNVFIWKADASDSDPKQLLSAVGATFAALGLLGGVVVPRRGVTWSVLLGDCVVGAAMVGGASFFLAEWISTSGTDPDNPLALGFWGAVTFLASGLVMTPFFVGGYLGRGALLRITHRA